MNTVPQKFSLLLLSFLSMVTTIYAAPGDPPPPPPPTPPPGLPIDNGLIYLIFIGLLYGLYKVRKYKLHLK